VKEVNLTPSLDKADSLLKPADGDSFKDVLKGLITQVDSLQKDADASIRGLVTGAPTDLHNVAIRMEEATVAFDLMMEIRNKLLEAYQEISRMQP
jgi:flagellar hook-basal body complex protein FliE